MGKFTELMIKKAISECIVEEMFRDLGFYVMSYGKEYILNPLVQLQKFIPECGGKFKIKNSWGDYILPKDIIDRMPDFVIISPKGDVMFLEVKYRWDARINKNDCELWTMFPNALMLVVNSEVNDSVFYQDDVLEHGSKENLNLLKASRFHVWMCEHKDIPNKKRIRRLYPKHLLIWLKKELDIDKPYVVDMYTKLVEKWLNEKKKNNS